MCATLLVAIMTGLTPPARSEPTSAPEVGRPFAFGPNGAERARNGRVRVLGALEIATTAHDGLRPRELSGLAWDADEEILYALSDMGHVVHLQPRFEGGRLSGVRLSGIHALTGAHGDALPIAFADAEGLSARHNRDGIAGNTELVVAFEGTPRIARYTPLGHLLGEVPLPSALASRAAYVHPNKALEALAELPGLGLVVAPERPLVSGSRTVELFALDGRSWPYWLHDADHGAVVGLEPMPGGELLVLERRYVSVLQPLRITLAQVRLDPLAPGLAPPVTTLARFSSADGWPLDNFEGVAHHEGARYFMVSDDNQSTLQKTLLVYFEVMPAPAAPAR